MSWSVTGFVNTREADWEKQIYDAEVSLNEANDEVKKAQEEEVQYAKETVEDIIDSRVVGGPGKAFTFSISGHANPNHDPRDGWANDFVTITVVQAQE